MAAQVSTLRQACSYLPLVPNPHPKLPAPTCSAGLNVNAPGSCCCLSMVIPSFGSEHPRGSQRNPILQSSTCLPANMSKRRHRGWVVTCAEKREGSKGFGGDSSVDLMPGTAAEAVNAGLEVYKKGKIRDALRLFEAALELNPSSDEAQAALYNKACCHAAREEGPQAQQALREALGKYNLAFSTILADPDMAPFRAMKEFRELQEEARKGGEEIGSNFRRDLKLISEVQAPFRLVRKFLYISLGSAAGIATVFTVPQLIRALVGGEGGPDLLPTLGNFAINVGGGALLLWLFLWEQRREEEQIARVSRDETLSRLPLRLQSGRVVELVQLRGTTRPVILAGKKETVTKAIQKAERYRKQLTERGVLLIPLIKQEALTAAEQLLAKNKGFASKKERAGTAARSDGESLEEFEQRAKALAAQRVAEAERRFRAEPVSPGEWQQWVLEQQKAEGVRPGEDVFVILRLDGRVRSSGKGAPDWSEVVNDLPTLDAIVSKLER